MFKKLLANLPFNPSLATDLSFYARRLRGDAQMRRFGFVFMALAFAVQLVAALYPAQNSLASSANNVLNGITNKSSIISSWDNNTGNIQAIYGKFGITRANILAIPGQNPNATITSTAANYWSVGRLPLSNFGISSSKWGERTITAGSSTIYQRPLHAWDTHGSSTYKAFHGKNQYGVDFWILQTCGNPTFIGPYIPAPPKPHLAVYKTLISGPTAHPGDTIIYRIEYQNTVKDSIASNVRVSDQINPLLQPLSWPGSTGAGNNLVIARTGLGYTPTPFGTILTAKVKANAVSGTQICNTATVSSSQTPSVATPPVCFTVIGIPTPLTPPPTPPSITPPPPTPTPPSGYCVSTTKFVDGSNKDITVKTSVYVGNNTKVTGYTYDVDDNNTIDYTDKVSETPHSRVIPGLGMGNHKISVYAQLVNSAGQTTQTKACPASLSIAENPRVNLSKSVRNITANQADASGSKIKAGDVLEFALTTTNVTSSDYLGYKGEDYFGSVLQYADIADPAQLSNQGITLGGDNYLRWTSPKIKANTAEVKTIQVKVKDPIPLTNTPSKISPDYNCKISNTYGNQVIMEVDCPVVKSVSVAATSLPNTGSGTSVLIGGLVAVFTGYLFARSRIMAKELAIVRSNYVAGGM